MDLAALLAPVPLDTFFRENWEKEPLVVKRDRPGYYSSLFSLRDLDALIYFTHPRFKLDTPPNGPITFVRSERIRDQSLNSKSLQHATHSSGGGPGLTGLREIYGHGQTIIINEMELRWPAVADLCYHLAEALHHPIQANLYVTPPGSQGFAPHIDTHDVFIVQVEGSKHWRLYGTYRDLPLAGSPFNVPKEHLGTPKLEVHLQAGDVLYIPRGVIHEAFTQEAESVHITVGVFMFRWANLIMEALQTVAEEDVRFRQALRPRFLSDSATSAALSDNFRQLVLALADKADLEVVADRLAATFFENTPPLPSGSFLPEVDPETVTLESLLEKRPGLICRVLSDGSTATLQFQTNAISAPNRIAPVLRFIADTDRFTARALPSNLGEESRLVLVRRLMREGLLRVVPGAAAPAVANGAAHPVS